MKKLDNNQTYLALIKTCIQKESKKIALKSSGAAYSYADVERYASGLRAQLGDLPAGTRIAINLDFGIEIHLAILAIFLNGWSCIPIHPDTPLERLLKMLKLAEPNFLISSTQKEFKYKEVLCTTDLATHFWEDVAPTESSFASAANELDEAYVIFTSGTTGEPKGVRVSQSNLYQYVSNIAPYVIEESIRQLQNVQPSFDLSVHSIHASIAQGATLFIPEASELNDLVDFVNKHQVTHWCSVPSQVHMLKLQKKLKPNCMPSLKRAFFCGEPFPSSMALDWLAATPAAITFNLYGPTEATVAVTIEEVNHRLISEHPTVLPLGDPFPGQSIYLEPSPGALGGEIYIRGSQVALGYLTADVAQHLKFSTHNGANQYQTGDRADYTKAGDLIYLGRTDFQVKINGYRCELSEIDASIQAVIGAQSITIPFDFDKNRIPRGIISFATKSDQKVQISESQILDELRKLLPPYSVPRRIYLLDIFPLTINGKIDRKALHEIAERSMV